MKNKLHKNSLIDENYQQLLALSQISPDGRTSENDNQILDIINNIPSIKMQKDNIDQKIFQPLCKEIIFELVNENQFIFKAGDSATKFYIVIYGKVGILQSRQNQVLQRFNIVNQKKKHHRFDLDKQYITLYKLQKYDHFGDQGIRSGGIQRNTAVALNSCVLMTISSYFYHKLFDSYHINITEPLLLKMKQISLFSSWSVDQIYQILVSSKQTIYQLHDIIYDFEEHSDFIYCIMSGDVEIFQKPIGQYILSTKSLSILPAITREDSEIHLSILGENQYFGLDEYIPNEVRLTKAICKNICHLLLIDKSTFINNLSNAQQIRSFRWEIAQRNDWEKEQTKDHNQIINDLAKKMDKNINISESLLPKNLFINQLSPIQKYQLDRDSKSYVNKGMNLIQKMEQQLLPLKEFKRGEKLNNYHKPQVSHDRMDKIQKYVQSKYFAQIIPKGKSCIQEYIDQKKNITISKKKLSMEDPEMNIKMHQMINALAWKDDFDDTKQKTNDPQCVVNQVHNTMNFVTQFQTGKQKRLLFNETFKMKPINII